MKLVILLSSVFWASAWARAVTEDSIGRPGEGAQCIYKGVVYSEGEELPTRGLCLHCICHRGFVEPNSESCRQVIDCPLSVETAHCEPVYNETECCPVAYKCDSTSSAVPSSDLQLKTSVGECSCNERYFKHYAVKGCTPVFDKPECKCPSYFVCPSEIPQEDTSVCRYKGKTYEIGKSIETSNPCEICSCQPNYFGAGDATVSCIPVECPSDFGVRQPEGCYDVYEKDKCCPTSVRCSSKEGSNITASTCEYNGKTYQVGQRIYPDEDPCLTCLCTENWTGVNAESCRTHDCPLERKISDLQEGCIPIYHEKTCCPIEFYCGTGNEQLIANGTVSSADDDSVKMCTFKGKHYKIGDVLDIKHPTNCVVCSCSTPPDITCVHIACPHPPNDDYANCDATYHPGQCCPKYNCHTSAAPAVLAAPVYCDPVKCPFGCTEVMYPNGCPICECNGILCSPPKCRPGCEIKASIIPGTCPSCSCSDNLNLGRPQCAPVKCDLGCYETVSPQGCPMCLCGPLCSPPNCGPGCQIQNNVPEGQCPGCVCPLDPSSHRRDTRLLCAPVKCAPSCYEIIGQNGCPTCICKPECSTPKCEPACYVGFNPAKSSCPICICDNKDTKLRCAPVKCAPSCYEAIGQSGCPTCICKPECSPPKCEPACYVGFNPAKSSCPICVCDRKDTKLQCAPVKCAPSCYEVIGQSGCPTCICKPECSPPKCEPACYVGFNPAKSSCPICICDRKDTKLQCAPVKCGPSCYEVIGQSGCPTCICNPECSSPKCEPACYVGFNPAKSSCPICICDGTGPGTGVACAPVKCGPSCHVVTEGYLCPTCVCDPVCSPPKCDLGCRIEHQPSVGPCPGCVCDKSVQIPDVLCAPVHCPYGCNEVYIPNHCPFCQCETVLCSPPKCDLGCEVERNISPGTCPGCRCPEIFPIDRPICDPVKCEPHCHEAISPQGCPMCVCGRLCATPKCAYGCHIQTNVPEGKCPTCECPPITTKVPGIQCAPVKCDPTCQMVTEGYRCPTCICDPMCLPPKCDPGCRVEQIPSKGPCPGCICDKPTGITAIQCAPVKCDSLCQMVTEGYQCPTCICDPLCSPPKCDPGCRVEQIPSVGPCPGCICDDFEIPDIVCDPVNCPPGCREVVVPNQCSFCKCEKLLCAPPKCKPGCEIEMNFSPGSCPSCKCPPSFPVDRPICDPVKCGPQCHEAISPQGCPMCVCGPLCSPPNCEPGCYIQTNVPTGSCPGCECPIYGGGILAAPARAPEVQCAPVKCGPLCKEGKGRYGCPVCVCDPMCSPPNCQSGCRIDYNPSVGPCPICVCDKTAEEVGIQCAPVNCGPMCHEVMGSSGCPACECTPICSPPQCDPGCHVDYNPRIGPCPVCVCGVRQGRLMNCPPLRCELPCREVRFSPSTCPACICTQTPLCTTPRCGAGCDIEIVPPEMCPRCVCDQEKKTVQCAPVKCGPMCREATGRYGCPTCLCDPLCSPPVCDDPGCRIEHNPALGPCPGCVCN